MLPLAVFLLVVMGALGLTLNRYTSQSAAGIAQEAVSLSAFYAAESGGQYALNQIFYSLTAAPLRALTDANCTALSGQTLVLSATGLQGCRVSLSCQVSINLPLDTASFYTISSSAECGSGQYTATRTIELSSQLLEGL